MNKSYYKIIVYIIAVSVMFQIVSCRPTNPKSANNVPENSIISETDEKISENESSEVTAEKEKTPYDIWIDEMQPLYVQIEELEKPVYLTFENGFSCAVAKEQFSDEYLNEIEEVCSKIEKTKEPDNELKEKDQELIEILNAVSKLAKSIDEKIDEKEYSTEEEDFHVNYVLNNMETGWEEIDVAIEKYTVDVNEILKQNNPEGDTISLHFAIKEPITAAIDESNVKMLTIFATDYFPNNRWQYSYYNDLLYNGSSAAWNEAKLGLDDAFSISEEMNHKFEGTVLSYCCAEYDFYLQDYKDALDYSVSSTNELVAEAKKIPAGIYVGRFASWIKPFKNVKNNYYTRLLSNGEYRIVGAWEDVYWTRLAMMGVDPYDIIVNHTLEESCEMYLEASKEKYSYFTNKDKESVLYAEFALSDVEYKELTAYVKGEVSSKEMFDKKLEIAENTLSGKLEKYEQTYQDYSDELTLLTTKYDFDIFEVAGLIY